MGERGADDLYSVRQEYRGWETFRDEGQPLLRPTNVEEYWAWAHGNLAMNIERGLVAEYLVRHALELRDGPRDHWAEGTDLKWKGNTIQVKSGAFMQAWEQRKDSKLQFTLKRSKLCCDLFIFAVWWPQGYVRPEAPVSIIDVSQWQFYLITRDDLRAALEERRTRGSKTTSVSLKWLMEWTEAGKSRCVTFRELRREIHDMLKT